MEFRAPFLSKPLVYHASPHARPIQVALPGRFFQDSQTPEAAHPISALLPHESHDSELFYTAGPGILKISWHKRAIAVQPKSNKKLLASFVYIRKQYTGSNKLMSKPPAISDSEWKVMKLLWRKSPQPAYDIIQALSEKENWHPNTIKTLLGRLTRKKALGTKKYKNLFLYHPLVSEEDCIQAESENFIDRLFNGSVKPLLVHFAKNKKLSKQDLDELRKILEGKETK
jgi:BlaI family penicillinase repressor